MMCLYRLAPTSLIFTQRIEILNIFANTYGYTKIVFDIWFSIMALDADANANANANVLGR